MTQPLRVSTEYQFQKMYGTEGEYKKFGPALKGKVINKRRRKSRRILASRSEV